MSKMQLSITIDEELNILSVYRRQQLNDARRFHELSQNETSEIRKTAYYESEISCRKLAVVLLRAIKRINPNHKEAEDAQEG